jgi:hypothetical protein
VANSFLPGLESLHDQGSKETQLQALTLAHLKITRLSHMLTPSRRVWPASELFPKIQVACTHANLVPPTRRWITILVAKVSAVFGEAPEGFDTPFIFPRSRSTWFDFKWMLFHRKTPVLLTSATSSVTRGEMTEHW